MRLEGEKADAIHGEREKRSHLGARYGTLGTPRGGTRTGSLVFKSRERKEPGLRGSYWIGVRTVLRVFPVRPSERADLEFSF
jgi:hypothetical protein